MSHFNWYNKKKERDLKSIWKCHSQLFLPIPSIPLDAFSYDNNLAFIVMNENKSKHRRNLFFFHLACEMLETLWLNKDNKNSFAWLKQWEFKIYNQPCWCKWPCSGIIPGKLGRVCWPFISNLMLLFTFPFVKFNNGSMLVGATLSSVVDGVNGGSLALSIDASWSWLCVCSCRGCW